MGAIHKGVSPDLAEYMRDEYNLNTFVETGTYVGRTALWASSRFKMVYTIESDSDIYFRAQKVLGGIRNVKLFMGLSQDMLPIVMNMFTGLALVWLDAHWSKDLGYEKFPEVICPVLQEIEAFSKDPRRHVILIDDLRLFSGKHGWPTVTQLEEQLKKAGKEVSYEEDVIVAVPND